MGRRAAGLLLLVVLLAPLPAAEAASPSAFLVSFDDAAPPVGSILAGARVVESFPFARVALLHGSTSPVALLALPGVAAVTREEPIALLMERERQIVGAEAPGSADWPTGAGVTVALVDSGIDATHPAFAGRVHASVRISKGGVVSGESGDRDGHGTHVAGIVGGDGTGSLERRHHGIAPAAGLVGIDISDSFTTTSAVRAFAWIHENAARYDIRVVSNSWGREKDDAHYDQDDPVARAADALVADGIVVVFSAGNRGEDGAATLTTEAMNPNVITVGAASASGRVESYSSRGPARDGDGRPLSWTKPDLMAPGSAVVSTRASALAPEGARGDEERYYTVMNGTSMAAPQVAAAAALLLSAQPSLSPAEIANLLRRSAADLGPTGADSETGFGMLDVAQALREATYASGGERRVVVESRVPVRAAGTLAGALGQVLLADNAPRLPPASAVTIPLAVPPGAAAVELWLNWTGEGDMEARLLGPDGPVPFERLAGRSLHVEAGLAAGAYRVEASPTGTAHRATWTLAGDVVVREERVVEVAAEQHGRPMRASGAFAPASPSALVSFDGIAAAPLLAIALAATGASALVVSRRKK